MFYTAGMAAQYREEPCRSALNKVKGMPFGWSLNPYMGCVHRCTFCYVRAFERRADRPSDDRYGRTIRVKTNVVEVLRQELARASWELETIVIGAATDPYQPAEGRYRLTRGCIQALAEARNPFGITTREHFLDCLSRDWPELLPKYEQLYARGRAYLPAAEQEPVRSEVARLRKEIGIADRRAVRLVPEPRCEQLRIAV